MCTQTGSKGVYHICITICHLYHHIFMYHHISSVSQYLYLCNHYIACICPQKAKAPKHTAQNLYLYSDGPQRPLISYHLYHCIHLKSSVSLYSSHIVCITISEGEGYCPIIFQKTFYTHVHKHIITFEISFPFYSIYLKSTQF